jgi:hypothetical protein
MTTLYGVVLAIAVVLPLAAQAPDRRGRTRGGAGASFPTGASPLARGAGAAASLAGSAPFRQPGRGVRAGGAQSGIGASHSSER